MPFDIDDDDSVAKLLAQDAQKITKTYNLVGLDAFNPKRLRSGAPKPNTNFLRHIIRQTDSHNAALLAKEAEDSSSRLRQMNRGMDKERTEAVDRAKRRIEDRLSPRPNDIDKQKSSSRGTGNDAEKNARRSDRSRRHRDGPSASRSRRHRNHSRDRSRDSRRAGHQQHHDSDEDEDDKRSHHRHQKRRKSYFRSPSQSRSRSPRRQSHRMDDRTRSPRRSYRHASQGEPISLKSRRRSNSPASDSDPLEAIIGPMPPPPESTVRSRGRGALKGNSLGIAARFSTDYDPSMDIKHDPDVEDDWDEVLEVMRDRERWKQQGADRLRAAGFKNEQVQKWEKGGNPLEEDVVWAKKGQDREWDRGKIIDDDGHVDLKAEWGRLK